MVVVDIIAGAAVSVLGIATILARLPVQSVAVTRGVARGVGQRVGQPVEILDGDGQRRVALPPQG